MKVEFIMYRPIGAYWCPEFIHCSRSWPADACVMCLQKTSINEIHLLVKKKSLHIT